MKRFTILLFAFVLAACSEAEQPARVTAEAPAPAAAPAKPIPHYAMREQGKFGYEYGYEKAISEADRQKGQAASEVVMMRYHGTKGTVHQLSSVDNKIRFVVECESPCEFFKQTIWSGATKVRTERARLTEGSLAWAIVMDAQNGFLEPMSKIQNGKPMRAWVTDEGPIWEPI
jgi:hypothetical protein